MTLLSVAWRITKGVTPKVKTPVKEAGVVATAGPVYAIDAREKRDAKIQVEAVSVEETAHALLCQATLLSNGPGSLPRSGPVPSGCPGHRCQAGRRCLGACPSKASGVRVC